MSIIGTINQALGVFDIQIHSTRSPFWNTATFERHVLHKVSEHTMTSDARVLALMRGIDHVVRNEIAGDIVECGVWRGGSMMAAPP